MEFATEVQVVFGRHLQLIGLVTRVRVGKGSNEDDMRTSLKGFCVSLTYISSLQDIDLMLNWSGDICLEAI